MPEGIGYGKDAAKKMGVSMKEMAKLKRNKMKKKHPKTGNKQMIEMMSEEEAM